MNILPIKYRFDFNDLTIFHSIINGYSCVKLPDYINFFSGSRLRSYHLDNLCFVSTVVPKTLFSYNSYTDSTYKRNFSNSFFYRTHLLWNRLPLSVRQIKGTILFLKSMLKFLWEDCIAKETPNLDSSYVDSDSFD